ncbi:CopM family metallochaperone [Psychrobacter cryohalolentis]|uniref:CopM family metallochaperone n=1 Tax=Psychrobacter cryohalolentis TaxID=330922 RepID=UPI003F8262C4
MTAFHRLALFATGVSAALLISACQPASDDVEVNAVQDDAPVVSEQVDSYEDMDAHDMMTADTTPDEMPMTDIFKDYTKSMTDMHNEMMVGMAYNDPDTAFAKSMLGHHHGAVDMAKIELKYGTDETMRKLAKDIIDSQQLEIDIINKWLASHPDAPKPKPNTQVMQQAYTAGMQAMHDDMMTGIANPVPDMAFARGMLPHHRGAVDMAMMQLQYGTDKEMRKLAQDIIDAQQPEIIWLQEWIAKTLVNAEKDTSNATDQDTSANQKEALEVAKTTKPNA